METWLIVLLSIFGGIIILFLISFLFVGIFEHIFYVKKNKRSKNISLLLSQKVDFIQRYKNILVDNKILLDSELLKNINDLNKVVDINKMKRDETLVFINSLFLINTKLKECSNEIINLIEIQDIVNNLKGLDDSLRQNITIYNNNVLGYNYWINIYLYRWYFKLIKRFPVPLLEKK